MIDIDWIRARIKQSEYYFSKHGDQARQADDLTIIEIEESLLTGRILEQYSDTGRGESCLVAGFSDDGKPVHAVCGRRGNWLAIVTVYIPTPPKFKSPYERG
ncbi:MAG: DUF4258 domain-containing protein [Candidatus Competibacteraceae bacterium]